MNLLVKNIKQLVTVRSNGARCKSGPAMRDLGVIENATVWIKDGMFRWIGPNTAFDQPVDDSMNILDATDLVGLPGFVDSHTHFLFAGNREDEFAMRAEGKSYEEIARNGGGILRTVRATRAASKSDLKKTARPRLERLLQHGTTTVEIKSGYGLTENDEIKMLAAINELAEESLVRIVPTFLGAHAVPPEFAGDTDRYVELICGRMLPYVARKSMARFCDTFCERGYFSVEQCRTIYEAAKTLGLEVKIHADQFSCAGASLLAAELHAVSADHLECSGSAEIDALKNAGTIATVLPGASFFLHDAYAPARKLIDAGVPVAIASDFNPGTCMSFSMPLMLTIACTHMSMSVEEAICAATLNGAAALGLSASLGSIEVGKKADMILYDMPTYRHLPYFAGVNFAVRIIQGGVLLDFS
jgi:imidazolonepropionase